MRASEALAYLALDHKPTTDWGPVLTHIEVTAQLERRRRELAYKRLNRCACGAKGVPLETDASHFLA